MNVKQVVTPAPGGRGNFATSAPTAVPAVELRGVRRSFPDPADGEPCMVLDAFDLEVQSGECVAIIGPSGCGKTTLLRLISGLLAPDAGEIRVLGSTPGEARRRKAMGVMFQAPGLLPWRTALQNVRLPLEVNRSGRMSGASSGVGSGVNPEGNRSHGRHAGRPAAGDAVELLELVGLKGFERHLPRQLSGGMQQRVALARALVTNPPLLIMDEPFSALDELTRATLQRDFLRLREEGLASYGRFSGESSGDDARGRSASRSASDGRFLDESSDDEARGRSASRSAPSVVLVTHSIEEAVRLGDRVVVLSHRPARIMEDVLIGLPWPRSGASSLIDSPEARAWIAYLRGLLSAA